MEELKKIIESSSKPKMGRNSMGCDERYYDQYYMVGQCFKEEELKGLSEDEIARLLRLADFAGQVFY